MADIRVSMMVTAAPAPGLWRAVQVWSGLVLLRPMDAEAAAYLWSIQGDEYMLRGAAQVRPVGDQGRRIR